MTDPLHVVCPHCHTTNRVRPDQLGSEPTCGQCKQTLFSGRPVELNDETQFDRHLQRSQIPLLVDFWASWCGPCRMMAPAYEQAAVMLEPQVRVAKVNTEQAQSLATRYNIRSIPTLVLFAKGREVARQAGALTQAAQITQWAQAQLPR